MQCLSEWNFCLSCKRTGACYIYDGADRHHHFIGLCLFCQIKTNFCLFCMFRKQRHSWFSGVTAAQFQLICYQTAVMTENRSLFYVLPLTCHVGSRFISLPGTTYEDIFSLSTTCCVFLLWTVEIGGPQLSTNGRSRLRKGPCLAKFDPNSNKELVVLFDVSVWD